MPSNNRRYKIKKYLIQFSLHEAYNNEKIQYHT